MNASTQPAFRQPATTVRVTGGIGQRFVQFEFSLGDPDLTVELVMRPEQFREFCARHHSRFLSDPECAAVDAERLKWRYGKPDVES
ncbi:MULTISPECIES: phenol hydroxylase subunit [Rhodanobacter]|uniref:phenol hydroxylase subunit n=1 Tax=Rhodanobacter TaxID=75309 RepID=UPI00040C0F11|nr:MULTISPECIES: phenol hydroxylase subunit [Rhodanobacter]UJJ53357.1 phenol hydroxylase subunit [Rhodanobacter thiooxydans]